MVPFLLTKTKKKSVWKFINFFFLSDGFKTKKILNGVETEKNFFFFYIEHFHIEIL